MVKIVSVVEKTVILLKLIYSKINNEKQRKMKILKIIKLKILNTMINNQKKQR